MGKKLPTINDGLTIQVSILHDADVRTYILCSSLRMVKEKQQGISRSRERRSGFFNEQLVSMAFCELSKAIAPNFCQ